jgi:hypothetical protein
MKNYYLFYKDTPFALGDPSLLVTDDVPSETLINPQEFETASKPVVDKAKK